MICFLSFKVDLHIWFPHAFSSLRCDFLLLTLIEQNQGKLKKSQHNEENACGNRMCKISLNVTFFKLWGEHGKTYS